MTGELLKTSASTATLLNDTSNIGSQQFIEVNQPILRQQFEEVLLIFSKDTAMWRGVIKTDRKYSQKLKFNSNYWC